MPFFGELFVVSLSKSVNLQSSIPYTIFKLSFYKNLTVNTNATPHKRIQHSKIHTARFVFNNFQLQTFFNFKLALNLGSLANNHMLDLFCLCMYLCNFYFTSFDLQYKTLNDHGHFCKLKRPNFCSQ